VNNVVYFSDFHILKIKSMTPLRFVAYTAPHYCHDSAFVAQGNTLGRKWAHGVLRICLLYPRRLLRLISLTAVTKADDKSAVAHGR